MQQIFATLYSFVAVAKTRMEEEKGATAVEYGLLVGLIAVAIIVTVTALGGKLNELFTGVKTSLPSGTSTPAAG
jgi:pilus assembly protein Flp/PilA